MKTIVEGKRMSCEKSIESAIIYREARGREDGQRGERSVRVDGTKKKAYRNSGIVDITKDEANPRSYESGRHKRQAPADGKDAKINR